MTALFFCLWLSAAGAGLLSLPSVHAWQLEAYKPVQYMRWLRTDLGRTSRFLAAGWARSAGILICLVLLGIAAVAAGRSDFPDFILYFGPACLLAAGGLWSAWRFVRAPHKKPLRFTARVRRLLAAQAVLSAAWASLLLIPAAGLNRMLPEEGRWLSLVPPIEMLAAFTLSAAVQPLAVVLAGLTMAPVERAVNRWYFNDARRRLASWEHIIRIGITGSYGKTSSKMILGTLLSQRYRTLVTPHSYNTPMGVARVIREQMTGREEVFVAEMGARRRGDITEMCELVSPKYGLVTSVGPQHLETFGTLENVARTKYELIESLPPDGWAFFPSDNELCLELYRETPGNKALFGFDGHGEPLFMTARDVQTTAEGSAFTLADGAGNSARCVTRLLGRHNIINILGCAAVAAKLGLSLPEIAAGVARIEPVEHRLQLIPTGNGVTVIDDAFNASPDGARAALEALAAFPGRKIVVTPGLVELGEAEERENVIFGRRMADVADIVLLVSRNGAAMARGLEENGFSGRIIRVKNLDEASRELAGITRAGDVVLFENDLPDHYEQ